MQIQLVRKTSVLKFSRFNKQEKMKTVKNQEIRDILVYNAIIFSYFSSMSALYTIQKVM